MSTLRLCAIVLVAICPILLTGCETVDGGQQPESQVAYDACTSFYNAKHSSMDTNWAFVSGVNGQQSYCYWSWGASSPGAAVQAAMQNCKQSYTDCFAYSTNAGNSDWVQRISNNGGREVSANNGNNGGVSPACGGALFGAGIQLGADIAAVATGQRAPYDGSQVDTDACK